MLLFDDLQLQLISLYPEPLRPVVEAGLPALKFQMMRLAFEVMEAESTGTVFASAVHRPGDYPLMARCHFGIVDILQYEVPSNARDNVISVFERVQSWQNLEVFRRAAFCRAAGDGPEAALMRFVLYQAIRFNLWVLTWDEPSVEAVGVMQRLDSEAEQTLRKRLMMPSTYDEAVRPLHILVAEALEAAQRGLTDAAIDLPQRFGELLEFNLAILKARELCAADAVLVRNEYSTHIGEEKLGSIRLAERHPHLFPSSCAVDTRRSRLTRALPGKTASRTRLIDIIHDAMSREVAP